MAREIDVLTAPTLKHLRDRWWDESFADFLEATLQPRPGRRILDVGCGAGAAELHMGMARLPGVSRFGVDIIVDRLHDARAVAAASDIELGLAGGCASRLPFRSATFDATFCVAVLQHLPEPSVGLAEFARVTKPGGRVVVVEPDNAARYWYSSARSGSLAREAAFAFFAALESAKSDTVDPVLGPQVPGLFKSHGMQPLAVRLFPVSVSRLGNPSTSMWESRCADARRLVESTVDRDARTLGAAYLTALARYAAEAADQGADFVEIQNTMLVATIGHRIGPVRREDG